MLLVCLYKAQRIVLLLLNPAKYRQSLYTNEGVKSFQTIARVATNVLNTIHYVYGNEEVEH